MGASEVASAISGDMLTGIAWVTALFGSVFAVHFLRSLRGRSEEKPFKQVWFWSAAAMLVISVVVFNLASDAYSQSNGYQTGDLYLILLLLLIGSALTVAPFAVSIWAFFLSSGRR